MRACSREHVPSVVSRAKMKECGLRRRGRVCRDSISNTSELNDDEAHSLASLTPRSPAAFIAGRDEIGTTLGPSFRSKIKVAQCQMREGFEGKKCLEYEWLNGRRKV
jgi:hypothetical protein